MLDDCGEMLINGASRPRLSVAAALCQQPAAHGLDNVAALRAQDDSSTHTASFEIFVPLSDTSTINPPWVST
jgi:hypothetical protein